MGVGVAVCRLRDVRFSDVRFYCLRSGGPYRGVWRVAGSMGGVCRLCDRLCGSGRACRLRVSTYGGSRDFVRVLGGGANRLRGRSGSTWAS